VSEYRSPAFPNERPRRNGPPSSGGPPANQRRPEAKKERPRFDITCAECGTQAQVPFKPLEGRQVFCQTCYRARRATGNPAEPSDVLASDTGIVE
jgi:CxxC-x17-CxxC domain-containing protein